LPVHQEQRIVAGLVHRFLELRDIPDRLMIDFLNDVATLEKQAEALKARVEIGREFVIPGETAGAAALDLARTIVRRGERLAARLFHDGEIGNPEVLRYLNRLSDVLFIAGRLDELLTRGGSRRSKGEEGL